MTVLWQWPLQEAHLLISSTGTILICLNKLMILDNKGWHDPALSKVLVMMYKSFIMNIKSKLVHIWLGFQSYYPKRKLQAFQTAMKWSLLPYSFWNYKHLTLWKMLKISLTLRNIQMDNSVWTEVLWNI